MRALTLSRPQKRGYGRDIHVDPAWASREKSYRRSMTYLIPPRTRGVHDCLCISDDTRRYVLFLAIRGNAIRFAGP
jgi:hypothetical protein